MADRIAPSHAVSWTARLLWLAPLLLLVYGLFLLKAPLDLNRTLREGTPVVAEVLHVETSGRQDVTYDYIDLAYRLPGSATIDTVRNLSLPHTVAPLLVGTDSLPVRVLPGAPQPVVVEQAVVIERFGVDEAERQTRTIPVVRSQINIAGLSAVVCLVSAIGLAFAVGWWNRYLARHGDPADRIPDDPATQAPTA
jgi:hypothetical protein